MLDKTSKSISIIVRAYQMGCRYQNSFTLYLLSTHFIYHFAIMDGMIAVFVYLSNEHTMNQKRLSIRVKPALKFGSVVL